MINPEPTAYKQTLQTIFHQSSSSKVKIAQLQSLKSALKAALKRRNQQKIMQIPKQSSLSSSTKNKERDLQNRSQRHSSKFGLWYGQQEQVNIFVISICKLFEYRKYLNSTHYQLQKLNESLEKKYQKYVKQANFQSISKLMLTKQSLHKKLRSLLCQFRNLSFSLQTCSQTFQDLSKVYKVQYLQAKEKKQKQEKKEDTKGQKTTGFEQFEFKNQNRNQILVNM